MKIINSLLKSRPSASYIKNESGLPWLELDISVPVDKIYKEFLTVQHLLVDHRSNDQILGQTHLGWKSLTIYGEAYNVTEKTQAEFSWTLDLPDTRQWLEHTFDINETTGRLRFMYLEPGGYILPHNDTEVSNLSPVNVAITNPIGCVFGMINKGFVPFESGKAFMLDVSNQHFVYNNSNEPRLHMILHTKVKEQDLRRSYEKSYYRT